MRVLKLHMREVPSDMVVADPDLCNSTTILEEINDVVLLWPAVCPAYPDGTATLGF
jgi:hypothetical protein